MARFETAFHRTTSFTGKRVSSWSHAGVEIGLDARRNMARRTHIASRMTEPADGATVTLNPPPFAWSPVGGAESYSLEVSTRADFKTDNLIRVDRINLTVCSLSLE